MKEKYLMKKIDDLPPLKVTLKQKSQLEAQRIRKYKNRTKFYGQNLLQTHTSLKKQVHVLNEKEMSTNVLGEQRKIIMKMLNGTKENRKNVKDQKDRYGEK